MPYRKADAGFLLDLQIENEVPILCGLKSRGQAPPYSTSVEVARTLLTLLAADSENVDIEELGGEWECTLTSNKGRGFHSRRSVSLPWPSIPLRRINRSSRPRSLQTIGTTFANLAEFPEAEKALKTSLELRVKAAGSRSAEAAWWLPTRALTFSASRRTA